MNASQRVQRSALVTGGAGGIGEGVALQLAADGYRVVVADLQESAASTIAARLPGGGHVGLKLDVSSESDVRRGMEEAERQVGPLNVLVHAAGILLNEPGANKRFWEIDEARWDKVMGVNARGTFLMTAEFVRRRIAAPVADGRIVLFSSLIAQISGSRTLADYSASKCAVLGFLRAAARECAPLGITVNAIAPGQILTDMMRQNVPEGTPVDSRAVPMARYGQPADIAAAVRYIVSPAASFVTGATFDVNGGQRMQ